MRLCYTTWQWRGIAGELHDTAKPGCCLHDCSSVNDIDKHIDRTVCGAATQPQAPRAVRACQRAILGPAHRVGDHLEMRTVGGPTTARRRSVHSKMKDRGDLATCRPQVTSVGDLPASSVSAQSSWSSKHNVFRASIPHNTVLSRSAHSEVSLPVYEVECGRGYMVEWQFTEGRVFSHVRSGRLSLHMLCMHNMHMHMHTCACTCT